MLALTVPKKCVYFFWGILFCIKSKVLTHLATMTDPNPYIIQQSVFNNQLMGLENKPSDLWIFNGYCLKYNVFLYVFLFEPSSATLPTLFCRIFCKKSNTSTDLSEDIYYLIIIIQALLKASLWHVYIYTPWFIKP